jgi:hypothetical protein
MHRAASFPPISMRMYNTRKRAMVPRKPNARTQATFRHPVADIPFTLPTTSSSFSLTAIPYSLWTSYARNLSSSPLLTKTLVAAGIFFFSDCTAQWMTHPIEPKPMTMRTMNDRSRTRDDEYSLTISTKRNNLDKFLDFNLNWSRSLSSALFGILGATWAHFWWGWLEVWAAKRLPTTTHKLSNTLVKVLADQSIGAPLYVYTYFFVTNFVHALSAKIPRGNSSFEITSLSSFLSHIRTSWSETSTRASEMLMPTMYQHWKLWPMVHTFNFYFIPLHHRVLVQNVVLTGWSGYLSLLNFNHGHQ